MLTVSGLVQRLFENMVDEGLHYVRFFASHLLSVFHALFQFVEQEAASYALPLRQRLKIVLPKNKTNVNFQKAYRDIFTEIKLPEM